MKTCCKKYVSDNYSIGIKILLCSVLPKLQSTFISDAMKEQQQVYLQRSGLVLTSGNCATFIWDENVISTNLFLTVTVYSMIDFSDIMVYSGE